MQASLYNSHYRNIAYFPGDKPIFCYRFGMTVYEEAFDQGTLAAAGWNTAGYPQNILESYPTRLQYHSFAAPQAFDVEIDGRTLANDWRFVDFSQAEQTHPDNGRGLTHGVITLRSELLPVVARVHTVLDGTAVMTRYFELTNESHRPMNVNAVAPMCGGVEILNNWETYQPDAPSIEALYSLGYFDATGWGQEGLFRWHALPAAGYSVYGRYRRDRHRHPMFLLRNHALGSLLFAQLGWAGGYEMHFDLNGEDAARGFDRSERRALLSFRMAIDSQKPMLVLEPGETYTSPAVHIGCIQGDLDDAVNAMHAHIRASVFTLPPARDMLGWVEAGVGPERVMDLPAIRHTADTAAAVGAEIVIIDAGWSCPAGTEAAQWSRRAGDWQADVEKYGADMRLARDYIHSKGLLFGLWMDAERLGEASQTYQAHPDWVAKGWRTGERCSMIDMTNPAAAQWVESEISRVIEAYQADLFRLDYNIGSREICHRITTGGTDACGTIRYYQAAEAMYARLRLKYPNVVFENCAGGGGRTDLAFVRNFSHTWVSDWQIAPRSYAITNGMTMALPPEYVDRLVSGMNCHTRASLAFQARHTLFGRPTTNTYHPLGCECNPDQLAFIRHTFDLYKEHVRPFMARDGKIYHHTPEAFGLQPQGVGILERAAADGRHGLIGVFQLASPTQADIVIFPRGINAALRYEITFDNTGAKVCVSGFTLCNAGLRVRLSAAMTSELILYRAAD